LVNNGRYEQPSKRHLPHNFHLLSHKEMWYQVGMFWEANNYPLRVEVTPQILLLEKENRSRAFE